MSQIKSRLTCNKKFPSNIEDPFKSIEILHLYILVNLIVIG